MGGTCSSGSEWRSEARAIRRGGPVSAPGPTHGGGPRAVGTSSAFHSQKLATKARRHEDRNHETTKPRNHETTKPRNHETTKPRTRFNSDHQPRAGHAETNSGRRSVRRRAATRRTAVESGANANRPTSDATHVRARFDRRVGLLRKPTPSNRGDPFTSVSSAPPFVNVTRDSASRALRILSELDDRTPQRALSTPKRIVDAVEPRRSVHLRCLRSSVCERDARFGAARSESCPNSTIGRLRAR